MLLYSLSQRYFDSPVFELYNFSQVKGKTKTSEQGAATQNVHVFYYSRISDISLRGSNQVVNETMIMAVDVLESAAKADFDRGRAILSDSNQGSYTLLSVCSK